MDKRWVIGGTILVAGVAGYFLLRDNSPAQAAAKTGRTGDVAKIEVKQVADNKPVVHHSTDPLLPDQPVTHAPKVECDPTGVYCRREIVDAVPDPEAAAREELQYKLIRLRLAASDAAAQCYTGGDVTDTIHLSYSIVVQNHALHAENVKVLDNQLTDQKLTDCIVQSVKDMTSYDDVLPDVRQDTQLVMSMHDLWKRNRSAQTQEEDRKSKVDPTPTPTDLPPVQVPK